MIVPAERLEDLSIIELHERLGGSINRSTLGKHNVKGTCWGSHTNGEDHYNIRLQEQEGIWNCHCQNDGRESGGGKLDLVVFAKASRDRKGALKWLIDNGLLKGRERPDNPSSLNGVHRPKWNTVAQYLYNDENDVPIARVDRVEPGREGKPKDFYPHIWTGTEYDKKPSLQNKKLPLYHLPEVRRAIDAGERVFFVEGEGKGDKLRNALRDAAETGAVTTIYGGSGAALLDEHLEQLRGVKSVIVIADSDDPGRKAARVRSERIANKTGANVRRVDLYPESTDGRDVADWLGNGRSISDLFNIIKTSPVVSTSVVPASDTTGEKGPSDNRVIDTERIGRTFSLNVIDLRKEKFTRVTWFEQDLIPFAELTLLNGDGGLGKTTAVLDLLARASSGKKMPSGLQHDHPLKILILAEEDRRGIIRARLDVAGANHDNIRLITSAVGPKVDLNNPENEIEYITFPKHARHLYEAVVEGEFEVVFIDAIANHYDDKLDATKSQDSRRALRPLVDGAHESGAVFLGVRHITKGTGGAHTRGHGSSEARNLCRSELTVGEHPDTENHSGLISIALSKANLSPNRTTTAAFHLESVLWKDDDGRDTTMPMVVWADVPPPVHVDDLVNKPEPKRRLPVNDAVEFLKRTLADGPKTLQDLITLGAAEGIEDQHLQRARKKLPLYTGLAGRVSYWALTKEALDECLHVVRNTTGEKGLSSTSSSPTTLTSKKRSSDRSDSSDSSDSSDTTIRTITSDTSITTITPGEVIVIGSETVPKGGEPLSPVVVPEGAPLAAVTYEGEAATFG